MKETLNQIIFARVWNQVGAQVGAQVWNRVCTRAQNPVWNRVGILVGDSLCRTVRVSVRTSVKDILVQSI